MGEAVLWTSEFILMRRFLQLIAAVSLAGLVAAAQHKTPAPPKSTAPSTAKAAAPAATPKLLPDAFAGWVQSQPAKTLATPEEADPANAAALKEYGFETGSSATYHRDEETLTIRALHFKDVSGSYGAYTFYRGTGWPKEEIGSGATSNHNRVIFWNGGTVVDANFSKISPESGFEMRELSKELPALQGTSALAPPVLSNLPRKWLDGQTTHYALGPAGYVGAGGVLPPELIGFDRDAEAITANYGLVSGPATLTLIAYPTPQMAQAQEAKIRAYIQAGAKAQPPFPKQLVDSDQASLEVRRTGPVVALVSGDAIPEESHKLVGSVYYRSEFVTIPQPTESEVSKTGRLLLGIAALCIIGCSAALLLGFFLGGGRALYRLARGKPISSVYEAEFIRLDLRE
jgi:hypothetical protein